jgi:hypothetical protein
MDLAIPLGNCLVIRKTLSSEKMMTKEPNAQVQVCLHIIMQLFFMKLIASNVNSSSIKPKPWTLTISTNYMYLESLWLRMGDEETFCTKIS